MMNSVSRTVLLIGVSLLLSSRARAEDPGSETMSALVLPNQRTAVHVWPIMRGCSPDKAATSAVVTKLNSDLKLQVHRLSIPRDPKYLSCLGTGCAELLNGEGCEKRSGILVGGEIDEAPCDMNDKSLAGCHGQIVSRIRVFRMDLEQNQPTRGDFRYAVCSNQRCGREGTPIEESASQLIAELVAAEALPAAISSPRSSPEPEEQCVIAANPPAQAAQDPPAQTVDLSKSAIFAYYTQYRHLNTGGQTANYLTRNQAEFEAKARATHFLDGINPPTGLQIVSTTVNSKYTLLPGEVLIGNAPRINTLQGYLTTPPPAADYAPLRQTPIEKRILITFVLDQETKSLEAFLFEPNKPPQKLSEPDACHAGSGDNPACIAAAIQVAFAAASPVAAREVAHSTSAPPTGRPLGCIPFAERSCSAWACPATAPIAAATSLEDSEPATAETANPGKWTRRLLYAAMGLSLVTAGVLSIADSVNSPMALMDAQGNTATINGLLRPAEWTAWGLSLALAVPTVVSVVESGRAKPPLPIIKKPAPQPALPRCSVREETL